MAGVNFYFDESMKTVTVDDEAVLYLVNRCNESAPAYYQYKKMSEIVPILEVYPVK